MYEQLNSRFAFHFYLLGKAKLNTSLFLPHFYRQSVAHAGSSVCARLWASVSALQAKQDQPRAAEHRSHRCSTSVLWDVWMKYLTLRLWVTCGQRKDRGMKRQGSLRSYQDPSPGKSFNRIAPTSPRSGLETFNTSLSRIPWEPVMSSGCSGMWPALILTFCHSQSRAIAMRPFLSSSHTASDLCPCVALIGQAEVA